MKNSTKTLLEILLFEFIDFIKELGYDEYDSNGKIFRFIFEKINNKEIKSDKIAKFFSGVLSLHNYISSTVCDNKKEELFHKRIKALVNFANEDNEKALKNFTKKFIVIAEECPAITYKSEFKMPINLYKKGLRDATYLIPALFEICLNNIDSHKCEIASFINRRPKLSNCFIGREKEIKLIDNAFATQKYVVLNGIGGIGKTELAQQYLAKCSDDYDLIIYADFKDDMDETTFLMKCENDSTLQNKDKISREDAILIKKNTLNDYGSRAIVFIDNLDIDINGQEELDLDLFFSDYKCRFLVTTRLACKNNINISSLSDDNLSTLMLSLINQKDTAKINTIKANIAELLASLKHSTLLVTLVGKMLNNTSEDTEKVIKRIIISEDFGDERVEHTRWTRSVYWHIDKLFVTDNLSKNQKTMLVLFSLLPDGYYLSEKLIKFWLNHDNLDSIDELIKIGWVSKQNGSYGEEYGVHPLISSVIRKKQLLGKGDYNPICIGIDGFLSAQLFKDDLNAAIPLQSVAINLKLNDEKWLNCKSHIIDWLVLNGFDKMAYEIYKKSVNKNDFNPETYMRILRFSHIDPTIQIGYENKKQEIDKKVTVRRDIIMLLNNGDENGYREIFNTDYRIKINHDVETIPIIINTLYGYMKDGNYENLLNSCMILMGLIYPYNSAAAFPLYPSQPDIEEMIDFLENEIGKEDIAYTKTHKTIASYSKGKSRLKIKGAAFYNNIFLLRKYYSTFCVALHILNTLMDKENGMKRITQYVKNHARHTDSDALGCLSIFVTNL